MNCSEVVIRYLHSAGISHVFGYPGDPSVEFLECCRRMDMQFVLATREGTAGFMAEAFGQLQDIPGVCLSTLGPGSSNMVNGVANAYMDRVPMIAISGQIDTAREPIFTHQVLDHSKLFGSISKWTATIQPHTVGAIMRKAMRVAMAERPGPVHISTPADVVGATAIDDRISLPPMGAAAFGTAIFGADAEGAVKAIANARRPAIIVGMSAQRAGAGKEVARLAESLGCPIIVSAMAKGVVDEDHPYFAGTLDMACNDFVWTLLRKCDLILNIGFDAVELIKPWSVRAPVVHVDTMPNTDQIYEAQIEMVGPIAATVDHLNGKVSSGSARWSEAELRDHRAGLRELYLSGRTGGRLNPTDVVETIRAAAARDAIATTDVGSHKLLVGQGWTSHQPKAVLMTNGLSSMGYSLPAAITAKLLLPQREVICFVGDGGLAMVQGELRTASSLKVSPTVVVFCDNSLNRIELKQAARQYPSFGTLIEGTNVPKLAEAMGCHGVSVDSIATLEKALADRWTVTDRPVVIAAQIDPSQYAAQF